MEFLTTCCFIVKINHCLKCGCIYPQQCQGFVVKYEFSVLFLLFFVRFSSTSLSEIWSEIFIFLETSTLECFLFVFLLFATTPNNFCCTLQRCGFTDSRITTALTFTVYTVTWHIRMMPLHSLFFITVHRLSTWQRCGMTDFRFTTALTFAVHIVI